MEPHQSSISKRILKDFEKLVLPVALKSIWFEEEKLDAFCYKLHFFLEAHFFLQKLLQGAHSHETKKYLMATTLQEVEKGE